MRHLVLLLAATSLALTGCGKKAATGNSNAVDETVTAQDFATNDTTAIDAATGADANMAADVDINVPEDSGDNGTESVGAKPAPAHSPSRGSASTGSSSGNSSSNAAAPAPQPPAQPATPPAEANAN